MPSTSRSSRDVWETCFPGVRGMSNVRLLNTRAGSTRVESGAPLRPKSLRRVRWNWPFAHMYATRTRGMTNSCRAASPETKLAGSLPNWSRSAWNNGSVGDRNSGVARVPQVSGGR